MTRPSAIQPVRAGNKHVNFMIYGEPGAGKSVLAGTSEKALILASNADEVTSAATWGSKADVWVLNDYDDLTEAYEYVRHEGVRDYDWCWLDNGTLFQEQGMDQIMLDLVAAKPHRNQWVPDQAEYLVNQNHLGWFIRNFVALPIHFGVTAHVMRITNEDGEPECWPMFQGGQGQLSQKLCGYFGVVGYLTVVHEKDKPSRRLLYTEKHSIYEAKDRYGALPPAINNATIPAIMAAIKKKLPEATLGGGRPAPLKAAAKKLPAKKVAGAIKKTTTTGR